MFIASGKDRVPSGISSDPVGIDEWDLFVRVQKGSRTLDIGVCEARTPQPGCSGAQDKARASDRHAPNSLRRDFETIALRNATLSDRIYPDLPQARDVTFVRKCNERSKSDNHSQLL
jgi:hypothetical protein